MKTLEIFAWIEEHIVEKILENSQIKAFDAGESIIVEWDVSNGEWYIIKKWRVSVIIQWQKIVELFEGNIFWEIALLNEEQRTATVKTIEKTEVIVLKLEHLIEMINHDDNTINKKIINRIEENLKRESKI